MTARMHPALASLVLTWLAILTFVIAPVAGAIEKAETGVLHVGEAGTRRTTAEIAAADAANPAQAGVIGFDHRLRQLDRSSLPQAPGAEVLASATGRTAEAAGAGPARPASAHAPQTVALSFLGARLAETGMIPPDNMGAVGPQQFVVFVNGRLRSFNKSGAPSGGLDVAPSTFFASVMTPVGGAVTNVFTSEPRIRYDHATARWILTMMDVPCVSGCSSYARNRILIAVSDAASAGVISPSTVWTFFFLYGDVADFSDWPTLGLDANALYIGVNCFSTASPSYTGSNALVVRKSSILGAGPIVYTLFENVATAVVDGPYTPVGVDNPDPGANEGYFVGVSSLDFGRLCIRRVFDPGGIPTLSPNLNLTVPATSFPVNVPHLGGSALLAHDDRLSNACMRGGRLWTSHNIALNSSGVADMGTSQRRTGIRWYEATGIRSADNGGVPALIQSGTIFDPAALPANARQHWIPSVAVSGQGHAAFGFSTAGAPYRINAATVGRLATDTPGTTRALEIFTNSTTSYVQTSNRWGDYSITTVDPLDYQTMWTVQQYCDDTNSYGCRVAKLLAPPPATPASVPSVAAGEGSVVVTLTGNSAGGSEFFDPGANLPPPALPFSHVSVSFAAVGFGGVPPTVNSVTFVDATHLQLDLNTAGATPNAPGQRYDVTVTNPDGQSVTTASLLEVTSTASAVPGDVVRGFGIRSLAPNPTRGSAEVVFALEHEEPVRLSVHDTQGREVAVLVDGPLGPGLHGARWNGRRGSAPAAAGVYFVRFRAGDLVQNRRLVLTR